MLITSKKYRHTATSKLVLKLKKGQLGLRAQSQTQGPGLSHFPEALLSFPVTLPPLISPLLRESVGSFTFSIMVFPLLHPLEGWWATLKQADTQAFLDFRSMGPSQRHYAFLTPTSLAPCTVPGGLQSGNRINDVYINPCLYHLGRSFHVSSPAGKTLPTSCPEVSSKPGEESGWASWFPTCYLPLPGFHPVESSIHEARNHLVWQWKEGLWSPMPREDLCLLPNGTLSVTQLLSLWKGDGDAYLSRSLGKLNGINV